MAICENQNCSLPVFKDSAQCALHHKKNNYNSDFSSGLLQEFHSSLIDYISLQSKERDPSKDVSEFIIDLREKSANTNGVDDKYTNIAFINIKFPDRDDRDHFDYARVLNSLSSMHFMKSTFGTTILPISHSKCFFQDCQFEKNWNLMDLHVLGNVESSLFLDCVFFGEVDAHPDIIGKETIEAKMFSRCQFMGDINLFGVHFKEELDFNAHGNEGSHRINFLTDQCEFDKPLLISGRCFDELSFLHSKFSGAVQITDCGCNFLKIAWTTLYESFEITDSQIEGMEIFISEFKRIAAFNKVEFGFNSKFNSGPRTPHAREIAEYSSSHAPVIIHSTYFESFSSFTKCAFLFGLDIGTSMFKEQPNFFGSNVAFDNTPRETLRLIKHSFDSVGNKVDANLYFSLEMRRYRRDLSDTHAVRARSQDRLILLINEYVSDFGQSYLRPLLWLAFFSFTYFLLKIGHEHNLLYEILPSANPLLSKTANFLNGIAGSLLPFKRILEPGMEFVGLLFVAIYSALTWQFLVAVKRHTRR